MCECVCVCIRRMIGGESRVYMGVWWELVGNEYIYFYF